MFEKMDFETQIKLLGKIDDICREIGFDVVSTSFDPVDDYFGPVDHVEFFLSDNSYGRKKILFIDDGFSINFVLFGDGLFRTGRVDI